MNIKLDCQVKNQAGLSLIELMVAMLLGLILIGGVTQLFVSNQKGFELISDRSFMQESGQSAGNFLVESIRMADFWGGVPGSAVARDSMTIDTISVPTGAVCDSAWIFDVRTPIQGFDGTASSPIDCISDAMHVDDSDVIVVRYADARTRVADADLVAKEAYIRLDLGASATIFQGDDPDGLLTAVPASGSVFNAEYQVEMYAVRPCAIINSTTQACIDDIPTLVRYTLVGDGSRLDFVAQTLVEGVDQLQFEYGLDADGDGVIDDGGFETASDMTAADWDDVLSVRIGILMRSSERDDVVNVKDKEFDLGGDAETYKVAGDFDYQRRMYMREVNLRNRSVL